MLTKVTIRNFKGLDEAIVELDQSVVLVGPNNSGKTSALQALALWEMGLRQWLGKRQGQSSPEKRPGVSINRKDLVSVPVPEANLLWLGRKIRAGGKGDQKPIRIEIIVNGTTNGVDWICGLEFDYANDESLFCRPLRISGSTTPERMPMPPEAQDVRIAMLPPMSGLAAIEPKWEPGRIEVLLGEGQTAQVLRNMCHIVATQTPDDWDKLSAAMRRLFGVEIDKPMHNLARGEIVMTYRHNGVLLDISSAGRGLQQAMLLLTHIYIHPRSVVLLDEPDAHLEILRQRQIYTEISDAAAEKGCQIIAASHSEVVLQEAAERHSVVAFVGKPHRINDRGTQLLKALKDYSFDNYYLAEQKGWVLYLEGSTDLAILRAFAKKLNHPASLYLDNPFVHYVRNDSRAASGHFYALLEACPSLQGVALYDRLERKPDFAGIAQLMWRKREIENYFCLPEVLLTYAEGERPDDLVGMAEKKTRCEAMKRAIERVQNALRELGTDPWSPDIKASDEVLDKIFNRFASEMKSLVAINKGNYHELVRFMPVDAIDPEISEKLDAILAVAQAAKPAGST